MFCKDSSWFIKGNLSNMSFIFLTLVMGSVGNDDTQQSICWQQGMSDIKKRRQSGDTDVHKVTAAGSCHPVGIC